MPKPSFKHHYVAVTACGAGKGKTRHEALVAAANLIGVVELGRQAARFGGVFVWTALVPAGIHVPYEVFDMQPTWFVDDRGERMNIPVHCTDVVEYRLVDTLGSVRVVD